MVLSYACLILQRIVLPIVLVLAALYRPVGISFVYLLMFFISPFIPIATSRNFKGSITAYLIILVALSSILLLCHIALQVIIISLKIDTLFGTCSFTEQLLRHIGFIDFRNLKPLAVIEWLAPEVVVFGTSLTVYFVTKKLTAIKSIADQLENGEVDALQNEGGGNDAEIATSSRAVLATSTSLSSPSKTAYDELPNFDGLIKISPLFCLATLFFAAVLRPSVPGGFYFLIFLLSGSYWATFQSLKRKGFGLILRFIMIILVLHALCVVSYQMPWMQQHLESSNLIARLIALEPLITSSCANDIRIIVYNTSYKLDSYKSPLMLLFSYFALALTSKNLTKANVSLRREQHHPPNIEPTETTPLVRRNTRKKPNQSNQSEPLTNTEVIVAESNDIPMGTLGVRQISESAPSIFEQIWYGIVSVGGFIYQNSYIFTNILMMAWSIVYHSWLTFVLLLWANVLWMIPNQRKAMMSSSPFVVIYAELLLVAQYIYGMDLTNEELPARVNTTGINLEQIGIDRPQDHGTQPCVPLIVKTAFLLMFWVTLRQFIKEKRFKRDHSAGLIAPLHFGSDTKKTSKFLKKAGVIIKNLLVRLWIWLLVLVIFLCAITGKNMTGFRICYMALFLFFLLVFQSSSKAWVKVMYGFWLFLIFYAMFILILIYTYQFDKFDQYWNDYLNVSKTLQSDIGLERYKTKDLFLHLVSPTIIVILTVIQVHYFHKRFIESLHQPPVPVTQTPSMAAARMITEAETKRSNLQQQSIDATVLTESLRDLIRVSVKKITIKTLRFMKNFKNVFWRFMELHFIKVVYIAAFVCSVKEVCLLHVLFVGLCLLGIISRTSVQIFISRIISFVVTVIILSKMIYQITYLDHSHYDVTCMNITVMENNAVWFGLTKASDANGGLMALLKRYIIYMVVVTLHAVVSLRQHQMRYLYGNIEPAAPKVLFPYVVRADAEKNLEGMIKFLFNYGFYKFGIEISMISLVTTIAYRQDIVAVVYAIWLFVLLLFDRSKCAKIWGIFQCFIAISIFLQYILLVGLPPSLCLQYPWLNSNYSKSIQRWAMLPGNLHYSHVSKLIFDFILLLFVNRQKRVFNIESRNEPGAPYAGGNNKSVVEDISRLGQMPFENPTRDFLSNIRNYLDVFKNAVFCGFYWVTLAVIFLAGTNIGDLLALGYLVGAFFFLWQGSEFYLRPIHIIINRWNWLITYNVANILIKTCLQMAGCIFMKELKDNCCWLVHLLGISCASQETIIIVSDEETFIADSGDCPAVKTQLAIVWDAVCFAFLLFQLRIFKSHYFCHIIIDTRANSILASRGAEIIEDLRQKQIEHRQQHEQEVLLKIKRKMEKIRATQQKMLKPIDKPTHFDEHGYQVAGVKPKKKEITLHPQAVRAGDYYMFEDMDDKFELDLIEDEADYLEDEDKITQSEKKMNRRKTLFDMETKADKTGTEKLSSSKEVPIEDEDITDAKKKMSSDSTELTAKDLDEDIEANPIVRLLEAFLVSLTIRLNRFSRHYRYVNKILAEEKKELKESNKLTHRLGRTAAAMVNFFKRNIDSDEIEDSSIEAKASNNAHNSNINIPQNDTNTSTTATTTPTITAATFTSNNNASSQSQSPDQPPVPQTSQVQHVDFIALDTDTIDAIDTVNAREDRTEPGTSSPLTRTTSEFQFDEEDFTTRDHNILIEVLISAWFAILANTDLICYIVVFINQVVSSSIISLPLPLMVFLWGTLTLPRPTKTFWVTLIAYTQAIVLIKCIFQFKLIWATYVQLPNQPLAPAKILGVELNPDFANYDLLLLLVLFFHRFILKSQGLWKSEFQEMIKSDIQSGLSDDEDEYGNKEPSVKASTESGNDDKPNIPNNTNDSAGDYDSSDKPSQGKTNAGNTNDKEDDPSGSRAFVPNVTSRNTNNQEDQRSISSSLVESNEYYEGIQRLKRAKYLSSLRKFFLNLVHKSRLASDVYALMFLCDFINFFVLLFGFTAFGSQQSEGDGGVQTYLAENKVPIPFLIMLLVQFILIVVDRALYLRKSLVYKIIFHFLSVIGIHIWMFFVVPFVTERSFYALAPPIIFYIIKCFYMLLSSYQIKCGYPKRILGNFLTKGFALPNMIAFRFYMQIPFLYELRTILDWVCTETTMTLFDWLKMEDIFSEIYFIRCSRQMERDFPALRGEKKALLSKLILGGTIILIIVVSIWGPLCLFALGNAVGQSNVPYEVSVSVRLGSYDPLYSTSSRESVFIFNDTMYGDMKGAYLKNKSALAFLSGYDADDITALKLPGNSPTMWNISPPDKERLVKDLKNNVTLTARFTYSLTRIPPSKNSLGTVGAEITLNLNETFAGRKGLISLLENNGTDEAVIIPELVPKFIKVLNTGELGPVHPLMMANEIYRPLILKTHPITGTDNIWWEIVDFCNDTFYNQTLAKLPLVECQSGIVMYTFNDKKFPSTFSFLTAGGIIGLYTTFVLLASRFLKSFISGMSRKIMFEDLPYVDRVLQLCLDIYLVREALEFALEEDLFAKLIFLYRSPETMIKWTRPKEETNDDETDTESLRSRNSGRRT